MNPDYVDEPHPEADPMGAVGDALSPVLAAIPGTEAAPSDQRSWETFARQLPLPENGRGLWGEGVVDRLERLVGAIEVTVPEAVERATAQAWLQAARTSLKLLQAAQRREPPDPACESPRAHGIYRSAPVYAALLENPAHIWDPDYLALAHVWWRFRVFRGSVKGQRRYQVVKEWRYSAAPELAKNQEVVDALRHAARGGSSEDVGQELLRIAEDGGVPQALEERLKSLGFFLAYPPRTRMGHSGPRSRAGHLHEHLQRAHQESQRGRFAPEEGVATGDLVSTEEDDEAAEASSRWYADLSGYTEAETPASRRHRSYGARVAQARMANRLADRLSPVAERAGIRVLGEKLADDVPALVVLFLGLLLARRWDDSALERVILRDMDAYPGELADDEFGFSVESGTLWIRREYRRPGAQQVQGWTLTLEGVMARRMTELLDAYRGRRQNLKKLLPEGAFARFTASGVHGVELEIGRLERDALMSAAHSLLRFAQRNGYSASVLDALFEREPGARNESHGHYIQMDPARLAQAFHDLTEAWMAWIGWQDAGQGALPLIQPGAGQAAIGSEYAPGTDELRAFATGLQRALRWDAHTLRRPRGSSEDANLAGKRLLRDAALYVWLQVALSTAARGVVHPAPRRYGRSDFHPLALIADKSGHGPGEARILGLPRVVVQSLEGYDQMLDRHAAQLGLPACPGRLRDGLNTIVAPEDPPQATEWQQVRPAWIERALATWGYPWPANAMRHFVASWCADAGIPEEIARAWLNHFGEGQQPIGPYSFSRSSGIAEALAGYAEQLLGRVGADAPLGGLVNE